MKTHTTTPPPNTTPTSFVVVVGYARNSMAGKYLQGPRSPQKVKRYGYGFTDSITEAWPFPSQKKAAAKALIVDRHMGWGEGVLITEQLENA